jgi:hypothetical protein
MRLFPGAHRYYETVPRNTPFLLGMSQGQVDYTGRFAGETLGRAVGLRRRLVDARKTGNVK